MAVANIQNRVGLCLAPYYGYCLHPFIAVIMRVSSSTAVVILQLSYKQLAETIRKKIIIGTSIICLISFFVYCYMIITSGKTMTIL